MMTSEIMFFPTEQHGRKGQPRVVRKDTINSYNNTFVVNWEKKKKKNQFCSELPTITDKQKCQ